MGDENNINLDLDPKKVLEALSDMGNEVKMLAQKVEDALGKEAPKSFAKFEDAAERGTTKVQGFFRNLGQRVKEDLKTAFDATGILAGAKFAKDLGEGVKQVFDMERAFDRLNTRLQMSTKQLQEFKKQVGQKVSATGQKLEDVLPGVETAASKGGVKSPEQLAAIGESLGQMKATTGEDTKGVSEAVIEILKTQGKQVTAKNFKDTLDALQATRVQGAFGSVGEAGASLEQLSPYAKKMGLGTRELGGMAATASRSGGAGQDILRQLMEQASKPGGQDKLNAIFGVDLFKGGKMNAAALGKIDTGKFGKYSQNVMEEATGLQGASGADLARFVDAFKSGMGDFDKVVKGSNETATQFQAATDNMASSIDQFKEHAKEAAREVGGGISALGHDLMKGNLKGAFRDIKEVGKASWENKGTLGAGLLGAAGMGALAGRGIKGIAGKLGGSDLLGGMMKGEMAKAAGIQPVYVTNASEIAGKDQGGADDFMKKMSDMAMGKKGILDTIMTGGGTLGTVARGGVGATAAAGVGLAAGAAADYVGSGKLEDDVKGLWDMLFGAKAESKDQGLPTPSTNPQSTAGVDHEAIAKAVEKGAHDGTVKAKGKVNYTNPSAVSGTGGSM